ncbi:hypothetical protein FRC0190_02091 [Corynebacterium rouxii]|uniref:Uncharacterized protein n=1 Tax=Corynebacterium rouxii TaxID=2719119 RepID=A0A6I8MHJ8_9CORY|nr:hypothetical protein FRC0190_02091 [Corynebacterium rouxii]
MLRGVEGIGVVDFCVGALLRVDEDVDAQFVECMDLQSMEVAQWGYRDLHGGLVLLGCVVEHVVPFDDFFAFASFGLS